MIEFLNISKHYAADFQVLVNVSLKIAPGEVLALIGHNGSGKSTFLNIINGLTQPNQGCVRVGGKEISLKSMFHAKKISFELLPQRPALFPELSVLENMFVGIEPTYNVLGIRWVRKNEMKRRAATALKEMEIQINNLDRPVNTLSGGQRAIVGFIRALNNSPILLALDEPAASLGPKERAIVTNAITKIASQGVAVILVTHELRDVLKIADNVAVLNNGRLSHWGKTTGLSELDLSQMMNNDEE